MSASTYKPIATMMTCHEDDENAMVTLAEYRLLERENAALRKVLQDADVLTSYGRKDGRREWVTLGEWLRPGQCIVLMDLAAIDTYRTKEGGAT